MFRASLFLSCSILIYPPEFSIWSAVMPGLTRNLSLRRTAFCQHVAIARIKADRIPASYPLPFLSITCRNRSLARHLHYRGCRDEGPARTEARDVANGIP